MEIKSIMVIGAGQMGSGIAQIVAEAGFHCIIYDLNLELVEKGVQVIENVLVKDVKKGHITEDEKKEIMNLITSSADLNDANVSDIVIEAVVEKADIKASIFKRLDDICSKETIFASNTSSLPISELAASTSRMDKFIGMHFFNPVQKMKLVELISGPATSNDTFESVEFFANKLNKIPIRVNDYPGFAVNRILVPMINEAIFCVYEGVATVEGIDQVMKLGANHPMGPLSLADFIGLDTTLYIMEVLYKGYGDSKYRPCPLLRQYVNAGWLGKKVERGFYKYN